ncbi:MAG: branched-chain amino acid transport system ATP-binding protein [Clostridia bacterium]|nr:branched-chain amino acid transport system ATP-binding protein [Clostridia bacterium]
MLQLDEIHTYYGDSHILQGVTMEVPQSSITTLLGRNGMGKTTTIHSIIGLIPPKKGKIKFKGVDITGLPAYQIAQMGIALVPQGRRIFRSLTVKENLIMGWRRGKEGKLENDLERIYDLFPILKERSQQSGQHLSGGEQQMLAIGRALMTNPELILMDEPFEGLAPTIIKDIHRKIFELKNSGLSILLVEQNIHMALKLADYVYIMNKGRIIYEGTINQLKGVEEIKYLLTF